MALIEMQADLKQTNKLLERIARCLERGLLETYHVTYGHCSEVAHDPSPAEQPTVGYATDADSARAALIEALQLAKQPKGEAELEHDDWSWG